MKWAIDFLKSSIGAKFVMAITGFMLIGFVLAHMLGNLQIFMGQEVEVEGGLIAAREALNAYGNFLQHGTHGIIWVMRLGLLGAFVAHVLAAVRVITLNRRARPMEYKVVRHQAATVMSRYMAMSGIVILAFLVFHLLHLTFGTIQADSYALVDPEGRHDVYNMVVLGFQNGAVSGAYIVAQTLLALHLGHAASSMLQTLGIFHPKYNPLIRGLGGLVGVTVFFGNISIPLMVLLGFLQPSGV